MNALEIVLGIILMLFAIAIIIVILLQEGNQKNLGVVTGGADTFLSKNKARSVDAFFGPLDQGDCHWIFCPGYCDKYPDVLCGVRKLLGHNALRGFAGRFFCGKGA